MARNATGSYMFGNWVQGKDGLGATDEQQLSHYQKQYDTSRARVGNSMFKDGDDADQAAANAAAYKMIPLKQRMAAKGTTDSAAGNRAKALSLTEGRGDATMNDPRITAALDMIQKQMGEGPYTPGVVNQQANRMADRTATAAGQTSQSLREQMTARGGDPNDPSFQAAMRAADTNRMSTNNANRGDLESTATLENYGAQNAAANQLANQRMSQLGQANGQYNQAANLYANEQFGGGRVNAYGGGRTTTGQSRNQSLGYTPPTFAPQTPYQYNPAPSGTNPYTPAPRPPEPKPVVTRQPGYTDLRTGQHMYNGQPGYAPAAAPKVTNWNDPGADNTQYNNAGDPSQYINPFAFRPTFR